MVVWFARARADQCLRSSMTIIRARWPGFIPCPRVLSSNR